MPIPIDLIPADRIQRFGPKRLKPMQGQHLDPKTGIWSPKFPKPSPDSRDRDKLKAKQNEVAALGTPVESRAIQVEDFRPRKNFCFLQDGDRITKKMGLHIPQAHQERKEWFRVVFAYSGLDVKAGDRVILDKNAHIYPVRLGADEYCVVNNRAIAAIIRS